MLEGRLQMKTGPSPTERTREFLSPQGVFAPSRFLLRKTLLHPFFRKQAALPSTQDRTLGANKTKKKHVTFALPLTEDTPAREPTHSGAPSPRCGFFFRAAGDHFRGDR